MEPATSTLQGSRLDHQVHHDTGLSLMFLLLASLAFCFQRARLIARGPWTSLSPWRRCCPTLASAWRGSSSRLMSSKRKTLSDYRSSIGGLKVVFESKLQLCIIAAPEKASCLLSAWYQMVYSSLMHFIC